MRINTSTLKELLGNLGETIIANDPVEEILQNPTLIESIKEEIKEAKDKVVYVVKSKVDEKIEAAKAIGTNIYKKVDDKVDDFIDKVKGVRLLQQTKVLHLKILRMMQ